MSTKPIVVDIKMVASRVVTILDERGVTRQEACKQAGLYRGTITTWENGNMPSVEKIVKISNYLNRSVQWLLTGEDEIGLSENEQLLLDRFRLLDFRDQSDILGIVQMKLENAKKGDIIYNSASA